MIHCGLNDIRKPSIQTPDQVKSVYINFKTRVEHIAMVNKRANIFVAPMLPTDLPDVNRKCSIFNSFIFNDLVQFNSKISTISGFGQFVGLSGRLRRDFLADDNLHIHLNDSGMSLLAKLIKQSIFLRKQAHRSRTQVSGRTYANALGGPPRPRPR